ncbi:MAG: hypothetical protein EOS73_24420 [Mesorhizobium sp.]|nr:MAG: hypothetical protein EOS73_24420 [Mesorhizobium sp.]
MYVDKVVGLIDEFNDIFGFNRGVIFRPVFWKKDIVGQVTTDPQSAINQQLMADYDLLIGLIGDRLGDATARAESGTAEEIRSAVEKRDNIFGGKHVQVIFKTKIDSDMRSIDANQIQKVNEFKASLYKMAIVAEFFNDDEIDGIVTRFIESACRDIENNTSKEFSKEIASSTHSSVEDSVENSVDVDVDRSELIETDDVGFFDEAERSSLALTALAELIGTYSQLIVAMTSEMKSALEKYGDNDQKAKFDDIGAIFAQKAISMGEITDQMRLRVKEHSDSFESVLLMIERSDEKDDKEALENLKKTMAEAVESIEEFMRGAAGAKENTENSPRATQKFNRGKRQVAKAMGDMIDISQYTANRFKEYISYLDSIL